MAIAKQPFFYTLQNLYQEAYPLNILGFFGYGIFCDRKKVIVMFLQSFLTIHFQIEIR